MRFGKFEIDGFAIFLVCFTLMTLATIYFTTEENIHKEETKQLELQKQILEIEYNRGELGE